MDKTPVYFDMVPGKTMHKEGAKTVKIRSTGKILLSETIKVRHDKYLFCFT